MVQNLEKKKTHVDLIIVLVKMKKLSLTSDVQKQFPPGLYIINKSKTEMKKWCDKKKNPLLP